ncbi:MAG: dTMP kinase [Panacagrimonas sp.]|nr:dTMP kinase [Panacagrimonas sp.]MCC2658439.1 dTMP kinase [Panacagrimonas sp.]
MTPRGRLVTLEGGEGAGKSTQARFVVAWLEQQGRTVVQTREPGGSSLAEAVRGIVLGNWADGVTPETELLLMFAARADHVAHRIEPALRAGYDVVCDRFVDATWAYQGAGRGVADEHLRALERLVLRDLRPDLTLVFDLPPEIGLARAKRRGDTNRFEAETIAFMERVRAAYLARAKSDAHRYVVLDATRPIDEVQARIAQTLGERFK